MEEIKGLEKCKTIQDKTISKVYNYPFIIYPNVFNPSCFDGVDFYAEALINVIKEFLPEQIQMLEIGTGAGYYSILSILYGAYHVTCTDINPYAIENTKENIRNYDLEEKITLIQSDIFNSIEINKKYHIVCWNIPFESTNESLNELTDLERAVYDPNFILLDRYLQMVDQYILPKIGRVLIAYSKTFGSMKDFQRIAVKYNWNIKCISEMIFDKNIHLGYYELIKNT